MPLSLERFPNSAQGYTEKSPWDYSYNCIAFAAGKTNRWWWPSQDGFWPPGIPREATVDAFLKLFRSLGYESCDDGVFEEGFEKVAIYTKDSEVTHAARQLPNGCWASKIGRNIDVEHDTLKVLEGGYYGKAVRYLKRPF